MMKLKEVLMEKTNDYALTADLFEQMNGIDFVHGESHLTNKCKVSIIIPFYDSKKIIDKTLLAIDNQKGIKKRDIEVIIVNDSPELPLSVPKHLKRKLNLKIIFNKINFGAGISRNIGLAHAKNSLVLFLDADTLLCQNYLQQHLIRHKYCKDIVTMSMRQKVHPNSKVITKKKISLGLLAIDTSNYNDFRYSKNFESLLSKSDQFKGTIRLLDSTNNFSDFGFGKKFWLWSLPMMVVTHNLLLNRDIACKVGGFGDEFRYNQWEDSAFGAKLIALNQFIVPILSTGVVSIENGVSPAKKSFFRKNELIYKKIINSEFRPTLVRKFISKYSSDSYVSKII